MKISEVKEQVAAIRLLTSAGRKDEALQLERSLYIKVLIEISLGTVPWKGRKQHVGTTKAMYLANHALNAASAIENMGKD